MTLTLLPYDVKPHAVPRRGMRPDRPCVIARTMAAMRNAAKVMLLGLFRTPSVQTGCIPMIYLV